MGSNLEGARKERVGVVMDTSMKTSTQCSATVKGTVQVISSQKENSRAGKGRPKIISVGTPSLQGIAKVLGVF